MPSKRLHFDIITPEKTLFSDDIDSFEAPGVDGEFQILADHTPFLTGLKIGHVYYNTNGKRHLTAISGGFCEVRDNHAVILAQSAELQSEIDLDRALEARKRSENRLDQKDNENIDLDRAELSLLRSINRINAVK